MDGQESGMETSDGPTTDTTCGSIPMTKNEGTRYRSGRVPLEHALILDTICSEIRHDLILYVVTNSPTLLNAVLDRHDRVVAATDPEGVVSARNESSVVILSEIDPGQVDRVVLIEPGNINVVRRVVERFETLPHDCLLANPYSFNRLADRAVDGWCPPRPARKVYTDRGFRTELTGYHGPRSVFHSVLGRLWEAAGRPDNRDLRTHRMRDALREEMTSFALLSCLTHLRAKRGSI